MTFLAESQICHALFTTTSFLIFDVHCFKKCNNLITIHGDGSNILYHSSNYYHHKNVTVIIIIYIIYEIIIIIKNLLFAY